MTDELPPAEATPPKTALQHWVSGRSVLALIVSVIALALAAAPYAAPALFGAKVVRPYLIAHPEVLDEAVTAQQQQANATQISDVNAKVAANPGILAVGAGEPAVGPADAKVTVVEFFDYQCPYCKAGTPEFMRLVKANPDVRFVFKEWPILDQGDKRTSHYAAQAALAAQAQGKYLAVHEALMAEHPLSEAAVDRVLTANGVTLPASSVDATRIIANVQVQALTIGINGTPTFFINGRMSPTHNPAGLAELIAEAKQ
jgi:protein-disulfide isomerase